MYFFFIWVCLFTYLHIILWLFFSEVTPLRRSGSVDSLLDTNMYPTDPSDLSNSSSMACLAPSCSSVNLLSPSSQSPTGSLTVPNDGRTIPTSPSVPAKLEAHRRGDIPSSPSVPNKLTKGLSGTHAA